MDEFEEEANRFASNLLIPEEVWSRSPARISLPDLEGEFIVKEQESSLVRRIFELSSNGFGYWKICQNLNQKGIASPGSSTSWGTSTVGALIRSKTVLGHLEMKDGIIENYYPAIISQELWASAQPTPVAKRRSNVHKSNVFTGLLYCGDCGGRMQVDSSPDREGEVKSRMVCQRARRGQGCKITVWRMNEFEYAFLKFVHEVDVATLLGKQPLDPTLSLRIDVLSNQIEDIESKLENLVRAIEIGGATSLVTRIQEYESTLSALKKERGLRVFELQQRLNADEKVKASIQSVSEFYIRLSVAVSDEKYVELRYSLASAISAVVERIDVYPRPLTVGDSKIEVESRKFLVTFRNGASRYVVPEEEFNMALTARN